MGLSGWPGASIHFHPSSLAPLNPNRRPRSAAVVTVVTNPASYLFDLPNRIRHHNRNRPAAVHATPERRPQPGPQTRPHTFSAMTSMFHRHPHHEKPDPVPCPACGRPDGFIMEIDGVGYRVLEDDEDTDLTHDQDDATPLSCANCDTVISLIDILTTPRPPRRADDALLQSTTIDPHRSPRHPRHPRHHSHPHNAGQARLRQAKDGVLPACPECPTNHGFLADIDGVAYHVLEDDQDTQLLEEANNLLCPNCGAIFTT